MIQKKQTIPWASEDAWAQVSLSISKTITAFSARPAVRVETARIRGLSQEIIQAYEDIEPIMERLCLASCPTCVDACCRRATVWYDLKDLLTIYLTTGTFPDSQICRRADNSCCNLTQSGCRLKRSSRPFICTWYICPDQKDAVKKLHNWAGESVLFSVIDEIKMAREDLEQEYIKAICG
jgi:hypothetical protein